MAEQKEFIIVPDGMLYRVKFEGGGEIPAALSGLFTSARVADLHIQEYKATRRVRTSNGNKGKPRT